MNIKLNAKLSAYSKVESLCECENTITFVSNSQIDSLFENEQEVISKIIEPSKEEKFVNFADIDSLFG